MVLIPLLVSTAFATGVPDVGGTIVALEAARRPTTDIAPMATSSDPGVRAQVALSLGRLKNGQALETVGRLATDSDPSVRKAAAFALGLTPESRLVIRSRLDVETDTEVKVELLRSLGLQGHGWDVGVLMDRVVQPVGTDHHASIVAAACYALGRLAMRDVAEARTPTVVQRLAEQHRRFDVGIRRAAAFALVRIAPTQIPKPVSQTLFDAARDEPDSFARAMLVRAAGSVLGEHKAQVALLENAMQDANPRVRVAVARAAGAFGWEGVSALLEDTEPEVRMAAASAVGQIPTMNQAATLGPVVKAGTEDIEPAGPGAPIDSRLATAVEALRALDIPNVWVETEEARYERVLMGLRPSLTQYMNVGEPDMVRIAATGLATDPATLMRLATEDHSPGVRMAAAQRLLNGRSGTYRALMLLGTSDPLVEAAACDWLTDHPSPKAEVALLQAIGNQENSQLVRSATRALAAYYATQRRKRGSPGAHAALPSLLAHKHAGIREAAKDLAMALGRNPYAAPPDIETVPLEMIQEIRSAVIDTVYGPAVIELYPETAPLTVWNFAKLAEEGFYDGLLFHRVVPDFVVQGGDPRGDGWGGPGYTIPDELSPIPYERGTLGMALSGPDTGGSQWFVTLSAQPHLDSSYTVFGQVISGMQVFDSILPGDRIQQIRIERVDVESDKLFDEHKAATESLAAMRKAANEGKKKGKRKKAENKKGDAEAKQSGKKPGKKSKKNTEAAPVEDPNLLEADPENDDDVPDDHVKAPEEPPLIETERVEIDTEADDE